MWNSSTNGSSPSSKSNKLPIAKSNDPPSAKNKDSPTEKKEDAAAAQTNDSPPEKSNDSPSKTNKDDSVQADHHWKQIVRGSEGVDDARLVKHQEDKFDPLDPNHVKVTFSIYANPTCDDTDPHESMIVSMDSTVNNMSSHSVSIIYPSSRSLHIQLACFLKTNPLII